MIAWSLKETTLQIFFKEHPFKGMTNQAYVMVQRNVPPSDNLEKLTRDAQIGPQMKNNIGNLITVGSIKKTSGLGQIIIQ